MAEHHKKSAAERIARMKKDRVHTDSADLVGQLTHESDGEEDMKAIAEKLRKRKEKEKKPASDGKVKYSVYVTKETAEAFDALCINRGDQWRNCDQALRDFVKKKARELGIE